jgi:DNA-directed RNA polymerase specialized sigma24 family protein
MPVEEPVATEATALLLRIAGGDESAVAAYDALLFPVLMDTANRRGRFLAADAAARFGAAGVSANVQSSDLEEVASLAAWTALRRARASALRFDPARGDGASWALGALGASYLDAAREVGRLRRGLVEVPIGDDPDSLPVVRLSEDPEAIVEARDALDRILAELTDDERFVLLAKLHYGLSYREIAAVRFGDEAETKTVDRLLQSAREKVRQAEEAWSTGE